MPDLWGIRKAEREAAARRIIERRGQKTARIYPLTSGLWQTVELADGRLVRISDVEISAEAPPWWKS